MPVAEPVVLGYLDPHPATMERVVNDPRPARIGTLCVGFEQEEVRQAEMEERVPATVVEPRSVLGHLDDLGRAHRQRWVRDLRLGGTAVAGEAQSRLEYSGAGLGRERRHLDDLLNDRRARAWLVVTEPVDAAVSV